MGKEKYIIEKAKELFAEVGYKATTMDLLAAKCDMGKGTLYLYFASKEDVLKSIIDQLLATINNQATTIENMDISFSEQIAMFLREMLKLKNEQIMVAKLVFEAKQMGNQVVNKYINQIDDYIIDTLASKIDTAISKGYIKSCNSKFKAFLVYKIYMLLVLEWEEKANAKLTEEELFSLLENLFK